MRTRTRKALRAAVVSGLLLAGTVALPASPAQAWVGNCSGRYDYNTFTAFCGTGTGDYRARARCYKIGSSSYTTRYGLWRDAGSSLSIVTCYSSEEVASGGWETRG